MSIIESNELFTTNPQYDKMLSQWIFWSKAYEGSGAFIDLVLKRHERESLANYEIRQSEAEVFNYCDTIVDLFSNYLTEVKPHKNLEAVSIDPQWERFITDVDLYGLNYDVFWSSATKKAGVYGFVGNLIDKPKVKSTNTATKVIKTRQDEINNNIYPYYNLFSPENVLDWTWSRNPETARPELTFLKLRENTTTYLIWSKQEWERWDLVEGSTTAYEIVDRGENPLGVIPFVWYVNIPNLTKRFMGVSDITTISKIQAVITRNLSHGNEVIKYAAFPMLLKPQQIKPTEESDQVGVTAVLEFDPDIPHSKAEWLESEVRDPIDAILSWVTMQIDEIYRTSHLSGVHGQTKKNQAQSGVALKYEFQQLFSVLSAKADSLDEAERQSIIYWMMWQNLEARIDDISIKRPKSFVLEDLSIVLESVLTGRTIIKSPTFNKATQKKVAKLILSNEEDSVLNLIDEEIDASKITPQDLGNDDFYTNK